MTKLSSAHEKKSLRKREWDTPGLLPVRVQLLIRGYSLRRWSIERGLAVDYVHRSISGQRRGPKARRIVRMIRKELGL